MGLIEEIKEFVKGILSWIYVFVGFLFFFFSFGLKEIEILGKSLWFPLPTAHSFSSQFFKLIQERLLPSGVQLIVTNPLSAFLAQIMASLLLSFVLTLPFLLYKIMKYLLPALFKKEKKIILLILFPVILLFFTGCLFSYFFLIPVTFKILYSFATNIEAIPFFSVNEFVSLVFGLTLAVGVMFLLPVFMSLLNLLGVTNLSFWKKNWKYAFLIFLIFSAIITPDGTGITMIMLFVPLMGLYLLGMIIKRKE